MNSAIRGISRTPLTWQPLRGAEATPRLASTATRTRTRPSGTAAAAPIVTPIAMPAAAPARPTAAPEPVSDLATPAERRAAAARIIRANPGLSDRAIARCTGLAAGTVASIRSRTTGAAAPTARVGWDGRVRPMNSAEGRMTAGRLITANPETPLRQIAEEAGISITTARDVRFRIRSGQHPVPLQQRGTQQKQPQPKSQPPKPTPRPPTANQPQPTAVPTILNALRRDPTLRYSDSGRMLLHWLNTRVITDAQWRQALTDVPPHCLEALARVARQCAESWAAFADEIGFSG